MEDKNVFSIIIIRIHCLLPAWSSTRQCRLGWVGGFRYDALYCILEKVRDLSPQSGCIIRFMKVKTVNNAAITTCQTDPINGENKRNEKNKTFL